ncbi:hypothetical protein MKZ38_004512 [Zalerion maritima]|uniref:Uncharacterized protein n=1 Tax=Zalerion maritima TaxID=339359 RepID=A0AAD5RMA7_9PEZI|nr:hypothetical protein MKZ38_004512 [Zalerion maritima]
MRKQAHCRTSGKHKPFEHCRNRDLLLGSTEEESSTSNIPSTPTRQRQQQQTQPSPPIGIAIPIGPKLNSTSNTTTKASKNSKGNETNDASKEAVGESRTFETSSRSRELQPGRVPTADAKVRPAIDTTSMISTHQFGGQEKKPRTYAETVKERRYPRG